MNCPVAVPVALGTFESMEIASQFVQVCLSLKGHINEFFDFINRKLQLVLRQLAVVPAPFAVCVPSLTRPVKPALCTPNGTKFVPR